KNQHTGLETALSSTAASPETHTWSFTADVRELPIGEYRFMARVYHQDGWYDYLSQPFSISPESDQGTTAERNTASDGSRETKHTPTDISDQAAFSVDTIFGSMPEKLQGTHTITLTVKNIEAVT